MIAHTGLSTHLNSMQAHARVGCSADSAPPSQESWAHCEPTDKLLRWMLMNLATNSAEAKIKGIRYPLTLQGQKQQSTEPMEHTEIH